MKAVGKPPCRSGPAKKGCKKTRARFVMRFYRAGFRDVTFHCHPTLDAPKSVKDRQFPAEEQGTSRTAQDEASKAEQGESADARGKSPHGEGPLFVLFFGLVFFAGSYFLVFPTQNTILLAF